jgi:hypothetical protein
MYVYRRSLALIVVGLLTLTACGGGGRIAALPDVAAAQSGARQNVTVNIDVPKDTGASNHRHPSYISPATTQISVNIQSGCPGACASISGFPKIVSLTPTSSGCTSTLATTECQLSLSLSAGMYVGTFTTLDSGGATLSTATNVPVNVVAGTVNTVNVSLSGLPASINTSVVSTGAATTSLLVYALDTDGNFIVGPGAPTYSVAQSGTAVTLTQPTAAKPNTITVSPSVAGTTQLTITASYPSNVTNACALGGVCTSSPKLTIAGGTSIFVLDQQGGSGSNGTLQQFTPPFGGAAAAKTGTGEGPFGLAFDASGNAYVANNNNESAGSVTVYAPPYTGAPTQTITSGLTAPTGVAFDSHGNLFVSDDMNQDVVEFAPPYTSAPIATVTGVGTPIGVVLDAAGDLFVTDLNGAVNEFVPPYTGAAVAKITSGLNSPVNVAIGPNGNLFVTDFFNGVNEYASPYNGASPIATANAGSDRLWGVTFDPSGTMYVADQTNSDVAEIASPYSGALTAVFNSGVQSPTDINYHAAFTVTVGS